MNITVTITGETPAEVVSALQDLSGSLVTTNGALVTFEKPSANGVKKVDKAPKEEPATISESSLSSAPTAQVQTPAITLETVRSQVQVKSKTGKRDEIKALLTEFGVERVTALEKDQYADFIAKLEKL